MTFRDYLKALNDFAKYDPDDFNVQVADDLVIIFSSSDRLLRSVDKTEYWIHVEGLKMSTITSKIKKLFNDHDTPYPCLGLINVEHNNE